jgi:hypothetical protein
MQQQQTGKIKHAAGKREQPACIVPKLEKHSERALFSLGCIHALL